AAAIVSVMRRLPRHTTFPTRRSSDLGRVEGAVRALGFASAPGPGPRSRVQLVAMRNSSGGATRKREGSIAEIRASCTIGSARSRSEEHTSELQSREKLVCRLLLEKKK